MNRAQWQEWYRGQRRFGNGAGHPSNWSYRVEYLCLLADALQAGQKGNAPRALTLLACARVWRVTSTVPFALRQ